MFNNKTILITGGTGSFGKSFLKKLLTDYKNLKKIVIFSRDELKQSEMMEQYPSKKFPNLRFFLGDIRDLNRLKISLQGVDYIVHAAALKQVPSSEYNPFEVIKTNVLGAQNLVEACLQSNVKKVIALSTDKAAAPINLYGASKLCSDKLLIAANNISGEKKIKFSIVRYGNVMGTRGSVIPKFIEQKKKGLITITDEKMTRFNISLKESIEMVLWSLKNCQGGEIIVPKIPSVRVIDIAKAIAPKTKIKKIGIRQGEKVHEDLITTSESFNTVDFKNYYMILQRHSRLEKFYLKKKAKRVRQNFSYNSLTNNKFLNIKQIKNLLKKNKLI